MNIRTVYRNAMRCYRMAFKSGSPAATMAAVSLVRSITGVWDIPAVPPGGLNNWSTQFARRPGIRWVWRHNDFGGSVCLERLSCPGKLQVNRSMTLFCRMTNRLAKEGQC